MAINQNKKPIQRKNKEGGRRSRKRKEQKMKTTILIFHSLSLKYTTCQYIVVKKEKKMCITNEGLALKHVKV